MICIAAILSIALPVRAQNEETSAVKKMQPSSEAPGESDDSATTKNAIENSRYFRFGLSGAFGRFRYKEDWGSSDTLNEIGRYQGPGIESALELGRQWKSGFAFGAAFQLGLFPRLHRFSLDSVSNAVQSETLKIKFLMVGFVFLHHPFGIKNGYYIAIRPGVSLMNGMPYSVPIPLPGFSVAMGYDFFNRAK
ncbi:MAG: hypothetical protein JXX14_19655, partial [Deltaproteobacteria bacterium]|nr:hypothetical protein [Deltaproteobacteria bacterium]